MAYSGHALALWLINHLVGSPGGTRPIRRSPLNLPSSPDIFGYWQWEEVASTGRFLLYSIPASLDIERGFIAAPSGCVDLSRCPSAIPYTVEFGAMVQVRHGFNTRRCVRRVGLTCSLQHHLRLQCTAHHVTMPPNPFAIGGAGSSRDAQATPPALPASSRTGAASLLVSMASPFVSMPSQITRALNSSSGATTRTQLPAKTGGERKENEEQAMDTSGSKCNCAWGVQ